MGIISLRTNNIFLERTKFSLNECLSENKNEWTIILNNLTNKIKFLNEWNGSFTNVERTKWNKAEHAHLYTLHLPSALVYTVQSSMHLQYMNIIPHHETMKPIHKLLICETSLQYILQRINRIFNYHLSKTDLVRDEMRAGRKRSEAFNTNAFLNITSGDFYVR